MRSHQLLGCVVLLVGLVFSQFCRAERDIWFDLTAGADALGYPRLSGIPQAEQPPELALDQRLEGRFNLAWFPSTNVEFGLHYGLAQDWRLYQSDGDTRFAGALSAGGADFRWRDLDEQLLGDAGDLRVHQNLDRLYGLFYTPAGDLSVGRQAISFGLGKVYSPVDVILPAAIQAQERSYRPGVDAVRWLLPAGAVGEVDIGWVFGEDQALFGRGYGYVGSLTLELTALSVNQDNHLVGLGTQTALGDWGLWQEVAWLGNEDDSAARATLGVDQQVLEDVYVVAEYHYNGLGRSGDYQHQLDSDFYRLGMVVPWGRHYLSLQASKPFTPLLQGQLGGTVNLGDGSVLGSARLEWSLSDNSSLDLSASLPLGERADISDGLPRIEDEFGVYPSRISVNWSTVF